ncbi:hypothetical protein B0H14DRAFT_2666487 [Mycena olivaceomarginata]|nr:hypothetical protein B0H14DRAFT_2666487 [Mycena olivaceomarginata]
MALQTHSSTPSSSTGTSSAASTTPTDSDPSDTGFSLSASPPLIIAFLAVGVFAISMVAFFGWRRITLGRTAWVTVSPDTVSIGETPTLWDVWSPRERPQAAVAGEWRSIQPLAATVWDESHAMRAPATNNAPRHHSLAAEAVAHLRRRYRGRSPEESALDPKLNHDAPVRLQIAVTIAMPCPDFVGNSELDDEPPLEYSIGLYEMPWKTTH